MQLMKIPVFLQELVLSCPANYIPAYP